MLLSLLFACTLPSPLYGTWKDNIGNKLTFVNDGSFIVKLKNRDGFIVHEGSYVVIDNVISFALNDGRKIVSEWDIGGTVLKLDWPSVQGNVTLTLYKTAN
ncbi:hypothetical protein V1L52_06995 [Treponema sp. HNW]|uniref:hypothetical protein n=1 Tax=Treponema sp. HNW TaxID=3116654 RepID=UPI003D14C5B9